MWAPGTGGALWTGSWAYREPSRPVEAPQGGLATSCMTAEPKFVDTNVLVYLFDSDSPHKQALARRLLDAEADNVVLSTQVLGEFYVTVTRKLANPLVPALARQAVDELCAFQVQPLHAELVRAAAGRSGSSKLSYWDALIVETAINAGATVLLTEDLQHGQVFDHPRIVNPFRP